MRHAVGQLDRHLGPLRVAPLYRTAPVSRSGAVDHAQPSYSNTVVLGEVLSRSPEHAARLLVGLGKALERDAGRSVDPRSTAARDAPRSLDVDLLLLGEHRVELPAEPDDRRTGDIDEPWWPGAITVPHPRLRDRRFVLAPLADLVPDLVVPPDGATVAHLLAVLGEARFDDQRVERLAAGAPFDAETV